MQAGKENLSLCENDARDMETIARSQGFVAQSLLTKAATSTALLGVIEKAARELIEGDFFLLTYSGHGGQVNDGVKGQRALCTTWYCKQQQEEPMSKHNSVTKRNRRPKSEKRADYTTRTMAAVKELEQAAKLKVK